MYHFDVLEFKILCVLTCRVEVKTFKKGGLVYHIVRSGVFNSTTITLGDQCLNSF